MKVLIDTSAWVDFLNDHPSRESEILAALIAGEEELCTCGVIVAEVFQGLRRDKARDELERLFRDLAFIEPAGIDTYLRAAGIYRQMRQKGVTVRSAIDCLIAVLAEEHSCHILARDRDLEAIVASGLLKVRPA